MTTVVGKTFKGGVRPGKGPFVSQETVGGRSDTGDGGPSRKGTDGYG